MGRIPRRHLVHENSTNHCTWRGHDLSLVLETPEAKERFLALLAEHKDGHGIEIHSYCLMGSHPHVQCRATKGLDHFSAFWHVVNYRFARWYNRRHERRGQVVMERMVSPLIQGGRHQLEVMRYGDLNPVRAGLVSSPKDHPWSSYRHYAFGEPNPLVTDAPEYLALAATPEGRRTAYVHLFAVCLPDPVATRCPELVSAPFVGDPAWAAKMLATLRSTPRAPG
jgi:putative transposase